VWWGVESLCIRPSLPRFVALKIVVCIGSDCFESVFSVRLVGLGDRRGPGDVDVCPNSGVWGVVACGGIGRE
jgi:hypothetical protein